MAPGASIISIRIANDLGQSDSFMLAKGIVAAVDAGARLINISLGSPGDSGLVRNAIEYARSAGAMIVAAAGNNGIDQRFLSRRERGRDRRGCGGCLGKPPGFLQHRPPGRDLRAGLRRERRVGRRSGGERERDLVQQPHRRRRHRRA